MVKLVRSLILGVGVELDDITLSKPHIDENEWKIQK